MHIGLHVTLQHHVVDVSHQEHVLVLILKTTAASLDYQVPAELEVILPKTELHSISSYKGEGEGLASYNTSNLDLERLHPRYRHSFYLLITTLIGVSSIPKQVPHSLGIICN